MNKTYSQFKNKTLMITGGTGSFGEAVLNRFLKKGLKKIVIFSRDEKKQEDMRIHYNNDKINFYIGDVRDRQSIENATEGVDYIFHAAALKQVPSCEFYPLEAVKTNINGTENVLDAAIKNNVKKIIILSTDKAVYPINAMGMTKALAEKLVLAKARKLIKKTPIIACTRYGNVMGSRGSVIPLFIDQIKNGKNITITDPIMTRFLMSLEESVSLVEKAFLYAQQGDIFVQKSPSATVENISKAIMEIFNANNKVDIIGTRHSEKLYETLISREELDYVTETKSYFKIKSDQRSLNYNKYFYQGKKKKAHYDDYTSHNTRKLNVKEIKKILLNLEFIKRELKS